MCLRQLIIANRTIERKKDWWMRARWVSRWDAKSAIFLKAGRWPQARRYEETVTQHYAFLHPRQRRFFFSFWPWCTGTTVSFFLDECTEATVKKGLLCLYIFLPSAPPFAFVRLPACSMEDQSVRGAHLSHTHVRKKGLKWIPGEGCDLAKIGLRVRTFTLVLKSLNRLHLSRRQLAPKWSFCYGVKQAV